MLFNLIISNIHNRTPKSSILFTDMSIGDLFSRHDFMKHWVEVMFYYNHLWAQIEPKWYKWFRAKRGRWRHLRGVQRSPFHYLLLDHTNYVKVWKYIIAICSLVLHRSFQIRCAILVNMNWRALFFTRSGIAATIKKKAARQQPVFECGQILAFSFQIYSFDIYFAPKCE